MTWLVRFVPIDDPSTSGGDKSDGGDKPDGGDRSDDLLERYAPLVGELWDRGTTGIVELAPDRAEGRPPAVVAGFDDLPPARDAAALAPGHGLTAAVELVDENWVRHDPTTVDLTTGAGPVRFAIVAGPAFGHGRHPTTRLALDLLSNQARTPGRVLDFGTGSGVLAITAHLLGAERVVAVDIDPKAVETARFNADANDAPIECSASTIGDLLADGHEADLIMANVLITVHEQVAADLVGLLAPSGRLLVSGVLDGQLDRAVAAYSRAKPRPEVCDVRADGSWRAALLSWGAESDI